MDELRQDISINELSLTVSTFALILCPNASMWALNLSSSSVSEELGEVELLNFSTIFSFKIEISVVFSLISSKISFSNFSSSKIFFSIFSSSLSEDELEVEFGDFDDPPKKCPGMLDIGDFIGDVTDVNGFGVKKDAFFILVVFSSSGFLSSGIIKFI